MSQRIAAAVAVAILPLIASCGDSSEETMDRPLSAAKRAQLEACLARAVSSPWRVVSTQPFVKHLSVTIDARSDDLQLPHRPTQMRRQQYVEIGIGRGSYSPFASAEQLQSQISQGFLEPRADVAGIPAAEFAPFVPYARADWTLFLNIPGDEQCRYSSVDAERPNPFVECKAKRGEYSISVSFPHDAIAHLPRLFDAARPLIAQVTSCFDLAKEP